MNRKLVYLTTCVLLILLLPLAGQAQIEIAFPFLTPKVQDYRVKILASGEGQEPTSAEVYHKDDLFITKTELFGEEIQFGYREDSRGLPEPNLALFYANYEVRIVDVQEVAGREGLVLDIYRKRDGLLVQRYIVDQENALVLNQYHYNEQGKVVYSSETLEIDFDPDFSPIDFDNIHEVNLEFTTLNQEDILQDLPWLNLADLPLAKGFQIEGFSQIMYPREMQPNLYLGELYPNKHLAFYYVWFSDGLEHFSLQISFEPNTEIQIDDANLIIVRHWPSTTLMAVEDRPISLELNGASFSPEKIAALFKSVTGIGRIKNPEALQEEIYDLHLAFPMPNYEAIAQETLSKEELAELAPWINTRPHSYPQQLEVVGYALAEFPDEIRAELQFEADNLDTSMIELVITLSNGADYHYVGAAITEDYSGANPRTYSYAKKTKGVLISFPTESITVFSHSELLSYDEQLSVIKALFPTLIR